VLVNEDESAIFLTDFGYALPMGNPRAMLSDHRGSFHYAAPEIWHGWPYIGYEVDVWAMGVVLYSMVVGRFPFPGRNGRQIFAAVERQDLKVPEHCSEDCRDLLLGMLEYWSPRRFSVADIRKHPWVLARDIGDEDDDRERTSTAAVADGGGDGVVDAQDDDGGGGDDDARASSSAQSAPKRGGRGGRAGRRLEKERLAVVPAANGTSPPTEAEARAEREKERAIAAAARATLGCSSVPKLVIPDYARLSFEGRHLSSESSDDSPQPSPRRMCVADFDPSKKRRPRKNAGVAAAMRPRSNTGFGDQPSFLSASAQDATQYSDYIVADDDDDDDDDDDAAGEVRRRREAFARRARRYRDTDSSKGSSSKSSSASARRGGGGDAKSERKRASNASSPSLERSGSSKGAPLLSSSLRRSAAAASSQSQSSSSSSSSCSSPPSAAAAMLLQRAAAARPNRRRPRAKPKRSQSGISFAPRDGYARPLADSDGSTAGLAPSRRHRVNLTASLSRQKRSASAVAPIAPLASGSLISFAPSTFKPASALTSSLPGSPNLSPRNLPSSSSSSSARSSPRRGLQGSESGSGSELAADPTQQKKLSFFSRLKDRRQMNKRNRKRRKELSAQRYRPHYSAGAADVVIMSKHKGF
jgi:Protein kinase domain